MPDPSSFPLTLPDYLAIAAYFILLCLVGFWAGRKRRTTSEEYFLAGRALPWYVVGGSFIASNISTEHFIGMIGGAFVYGICVANFEWLNVTTFSLMIWFFIPFLLVTKVFTIPEFLERRFNPFLRLLFALVTVVSNVTAFLAAVLYGGGLALEKLFGWNLWFAIIALGVVAGSWAIYGGLRSVAWTDLLTVIVMIAGGTMVTIFGLYMLSGDANSLVEGFKVMIERNQANEGIWADVVSRNAQNIAHSDEYNRLALVQPLTHEVIPWPTMIFGTFSLGIWYSVLNQFMIQRVLGAKNAYHARMGMVFAGYMKILLPVIVVMPGLILFAKYPEVLSLPWDQVKPEADKGYVAMLQKLIPAGLRGLFLAALFGAIQSTVNSVLNSTSTVCTLDIYKRLIRKDASERNLVKVGMGSSVVILVLAIVLAGFVGELEGSLFVYVQTLYAFFAAPFAAVFLLGILFRRINSQGATVAVVVGFAFAVAVKIYVERPDHVVWLEPFGMQAIFTWAVSMLTCVVGSLLTPRPSPEKVSDQVTFNWSQLNIFEDLGSRWYTHVVLWWGIFCVIVFSLLLVFSGLYV